MNNSNQNQKPIELKDIHEVLVEICDQIKESSKWTKFAGIKEIKPILETQLPNDSKKIIYQLSDSSRGTQEIAKIIGGLSHQTVSNYWKVWEKTGLGESVSVGGGTRFKRSFDLGDFGIKIPELQKQEELPNPATEKTKEQSTVKVESDG